MKTTLATLIVALLTISAIGKDRHCIFRLHGKANPQDTAILSSSVGALFSEKRELFIDRCVSGGRISTGSGLTKVDIDPMKKDCRLIG